LAKHIFHKHKKGETVNALKVII